MSVPSAVCTRQAHDPRNAASVIDDLVLRVRQPERLLPPDGGQLRPGQRADKIALRIGDVGSGGKKLRAVDKLCRLRNGWFARSRRFACCRLTRQRGDGKRRLRRGIFPRVQPEQSACSQQGAGRKRAPFQYRMPARRWLGQRLQQIVVDLMEGIIQILRSHKSSSCSR